jgi:hypothetical protein
MTQRDTLFGQAFNMSMEDNVRMFLVDRKSYAPLRTNVGVGEDYAGGIYASWLWAVTIHFKTTGDVPIAPST